MGNWQRRYGRKKARGYFQGNRQEMPSYLKRGGIEDEPLWEHEDRVRRQHERGRKEGLREFVRKYPDARVYKIQTWNSSYSSRTARLEGDRLYLSYSTSDGASSSRELTLQFPCVVITWSYLNPYSRSDYVSGTASYYDREGNLVESTHFQLSQIEVDAIKGEEV